MSSPLFERLGAGWNPDAMLHPYSVRLQEKGGVCSGGGHIHGGDDRRQELKCRRKSLPAGFSVPEGWRVPAVPDDSGAGMKARLAVEIERSRAVWAWYGMEGMCRRKCSDERRIVFDCDNTFGIKNCDVDDRADPDVFAGGSGSQFSGGHFHYGNSLDVVQEVNLRMLEEELGRRDIPVKRRGEEAVTNEAAGFSGNGGPPSGNCRFLPRFP